MNRRKNKKLYAPGTLVTIKGKHCVFMSLGLRNKNSLDSFNGIDILTGKPVARCDGQARLATKKEQRLYWTYIRSLAIKKETQP